MTAPITEPITEPIIESITALIAELAIQSDRIGARLEMMLCHH